MATSSFEKTFVVRDSGTAGALRSEISKKNPIKVMRRDFSESKKKGAQLLKQYHSA